MKVSVPRKRKNTKTLIRIATIAAAISIVIIMWWLPNLPAKLSGQFMMTRIIHNETIGVVIDGTIKNSGLTGATNVIVHFVFYDIQGNIIAERDSPPYLIGPLSAKDITLRYKVDASDFKWLFVNP